MSLQEQRPRERIQLKAEVFPTHTTIQKQVENRGLEPDVQMKDGENQNEDKMDIDEKLGKQKNFVTPVKIPILEKEPPKMLRKKGRKLKIRKTISVKLEEQGDKDIEMFETPSPSNPSLEKRQKQQQRNVKRKDLEIIDIGEVELYNETISYITDFVKRKKYKPTKIHYYNLPSSNISGAIMELPNKPKNFKSRIIQTNYNEIDNGKFIYNTLVNTENLKTKVLKRKRASLKSSSPHSNEFDEVNRPLKFRKVGEAGQKRGVVTNVEQKRLVDNNPAMFSSLKVNKTLREKLGYWILRCCVNLFKYNSNCGKSNLIINIEKKIIILKKYIESLKMMIVGDATKYKLLFCQNRDLFTYILSHVEYNHSKPTVKGTNVKDEVFFWMDKVKKKELMEFGEVFKIYSILENEMIQILLELLKKLHKEYESPLKLNDLYIL